MTNEQIEALKREVKKHLENMGDFYDERLPDTIIDFLSSQNRLLADGCVGCPIIPTEAMIDAGENTFVSAYTGTPTSTPEDVYAAMITAAQTEKREGE